MKGKNEKSVPVNGSRRRLKYLIPKWQLVTRFLSQQSGIVIGSALAALGYVLFQLPFQIAAGGISGLIIVINNYIPVSVGLLYMLINIPLIIWGYYSLGGLRFIFSTSVSVVSFSVFSDIFVRYLPDMMRRYPVSEDLLLNTIYAGVVFGFGAGLIYRAGGTIGGTSIPARILQKHTGFPLSQSYMVTDMAIILLAGFVFSWEKAMLATLALLLGGMVSDFVLEGVSQVRIAMIITEHPKMMSHTLMNELQRGVSTWSVTGAYTEQSRSMLYCTVRRSQVSDLKYIVSAVDEKAFLVIGNAQQAYGGFGFTHLKPAKKT
ncbi:YitT family protein [Limisalsivibrio acetivorans]|uniref:YitT family protein n=1 Tax=Limisalsivibrio acetivorans TaxID=1304888 RepID=UPI0003B3FC01|nr:YitT family protein [Limisalsivibrio acetivorans]